MAKRPDLTDIDVGRRVRALRLERGMSQEKLACALDLTFQQVQKYEKGTNRIGAGRLQRIAGILEVPVSTFFTDTKNSTHTESIFELVESASAFRLLDAHSRIPSPKLRQALTKLAEELAERHHQP